MGQFIAYLFQFKAKVIISNMYYVIMEHKKALQSFICRGNYSS